MRPGVRPFFARRKQSLGAKSAAELGERGRSCTSKAPRALSAARCDLRSETYLEAGRDCDPGLAGGAGRRRAQHRALSGAAATGPRATGGDGRVLPSTRRPLRVKVPDGGPGPGLR